MSEANGWQRIDRNIKRTPAGSYQVRFSKGKATLLCQTFKRLEDAVAKRNEVRLRITLGHPPEDVAYGPLTELENIRQWVSYCAETGTFIGNKPRRCVAKGAPVGLGESVAGYKVVSVGRMRYQGHRLAWMMHYGRWPTGDIDHINGIRTDNRICNLREVTRAENALNRKDRKNKTGYTGVYAYRLTGRTLFAAQVRLQHRPVYSRGHESPEAAHKEYLRLRRELFGSLARY